MGSNVSVDKGSESAVKSRFSFRSKSKDKFINGKNPIAQFGFKPPESSVNVGSKDETFFDSQAWLDSDCEEDFLSVNGDFTPSRGSTSNHRSSFTESPRLSISLDTDRTSNLKPDESYPTDKKKRLLDLLQESFDDNYKLSNDPKIDNNGNVDAKLVSLDLPPKSSNGTPYLSKSNSVRSSGERTPSRYSKPPKPKSAKATKCCMPSLVPSLSFTERKKRLSPANSFRE